MKQIILLLLNILVTGLAVASPRKVLVEMFTNAYCVECPPAHATLSSYANSSANAASIRYIFYHNCNSASDALYRASSSDADARILYYGTGCTAPVAFFDGVNVETLYSTWAGLLDSRVAVSSPMTVSLSGTADGNTITVNASVTATADIAASDLVIHFVLVESVDYTGGNGVTPNPFVMRQMITGGTGQSISISNGQTLTVSKSTTFTNVTNNDSTGVVVFVQRSSTKEVYQSEYIPYRDLTVTGIAVTPSPAQFILEQNYPNPFNPSTVIRYALREKTHVTMSVCTTLGQQLAILVNEIQDAGFHEVKFDGSGVASGVYLYRLQAGAFVQTKKLLLIK